MLDKVYLDKVGKYVRDCNEKLVQSEIERVSQITFFDADSLTLALSAEPGYSPLLNFFSVSPERMFIFGVAPDTSFENTPNCYITTTGLVVVLSGGALALSSNEVF